MGKSLQFNEYKTWYMESYGDKVNTNTQGNKMPKESASYKCLSLIIWDFVIRAKRRFYPQTLLEECKYEVTRDKVENLINDDLDLSSSNESDCKFDNVSDNGSDNDESND